MRVPDVLFILVEERTNIALKGARKGSPPFPQFRGTHVLGDVYPINYIVLGAVSSISPAVSAVAVLPLELATLLLRVVKSISSS